MYSSLGLRRVQDLLFTILNIIIHPVVSIWLLISWRLKYVKLGEMIPGPPSLPLLGSCLGIEEFTTKGIFNHANKVFCKYTKNSPIVRIYGGPYLIVFSNDPKDNANVLSGYKFLNKGQFYKFLNPWLGCGLLTSKGDKWMSRRKLLTSSFHLSILEQFVPVFNSCGDELVRLWRMRSGKGGFDVCQEMKLLTLDIICETTMGVQINAQTNSNLEYVTAINEAMRLITERVFRPWLYLDYIYNLTQAGRKYRKCLDLIHGTTDKVIQQRRKQLENLTKEVDFLDVDEIGRRRRVAFLDLLLLAARAGGLSDVDVREEVNTFMFAGYETTYAALSFTIFLLSRHQDVQEKVLAELRGVFHPSQPTSQHLSELRYLEMVIKESLRLYPPVAALLRYISEDITLSSTANVVPSGSYMFVSPYGVHRNPELYPDPEQFDPERFRPEECAKRHPFAFLPFSAGPRNCIGQRFAMLEMKSVLAKLVWNFRILPEPGFEPEITWEVTLKSLNGLHVRLEDRHLPGLCI